MGTVNSNIELQGIDGQGDGALGIEGFENPIIALNGHFNKNLRATISYSAQSGQLVVKIGSPTLTIKTQVSQLNSRMSTGLQALNGKTTRVKFEKRSSSLVGMHIEPVVQ